MTIVTKKVFLLLLLLSMATSVFAAIEEYDFDTEEQEERFQTLTDEMRCPKCLNANLSGSDAPIAADLRAEILDQILEGRSDDQIVEFMTARYGDFILYRPPLNTGTFVLWFGPFMLLLIGFAILRGLMKRSQEQGGGLALSAQEQEKLDAYLSADAALNSKPSSGANSANSSSHSNSD